MSHSIYICEISSLCSRRCGTAGVCSCVLDESPSVSDWRIIVFKNRLKLSYGLWFSTFLKCRWWLWPFKLNHFLFCFFMKSIEPIYRPRLGFEPIVDVITPRLGLLLLSAICDSADMLTHAFQILLSQWHPGYLMTTAIWEERGLPRGPSDPLLSNPAGGEKKHWEEAPKIRALIKIYCSTSLWTADTSVIQGPVLSRFRFSNRASVQMWRKKLLLDFM